jgi:radical SAM protein with 4Fe4S-binding SPASM domain
VKRFNRQSILETLEARRLNHPRLGDLTAYDAVRLPGSGAHAFPRARSPLFIHLTATTRCNARCLGCINHEVTFSSLTKDELHALFREMDPDRDAIAIAHLVSRDDPEEVAVCIYGGEPLLVPDRVDRVMSEIRARVSPTPLRFMIYTNGQLIDQATAAFPGLLDDVWLYSVSVDGTAEQHDRIRRGTRLARIERNLELLRKRGYRGQVLMWSTLRENQSLGDCFEEFVRLERRGLVDHWFWHWVETCESFADLGKAAAAYEVDLERILDFYCASLESGRLPSIIHLNELVLYALTGQQRGTTACGVERATNYDIIGGTVQTCADLPPEFTLGAIAADGSVSLQERDLERLVQYKDDLGCPSCGIHAYCGGRCPVQALTSGAERLVDYCQLLRLHVAVVLDHLPRIEAAIRRHGITMQDIYDRSAHVTRFTDVTP